MTKVEEIKKFEKEYNLSSFNKNWFEKISEKEYKERTKNILLSEKPRKVWKDIVKRFFTNKWNVIFLSIFIALLILISIGSTFSHFSDTKPVSNRTIEDIKYLSPFKSTLDFSGTFNDVKTQLGDSSGIIHAQNGILISNDPSKINIISSSLSTSNGNYIWTVKYENMNYVKTIMGTDSIGRSVWQRLMSSSKFSISLAFLVTTIETIFGTIIGLYLGYNVGKWFDTYFMRLVEIISSIPGILLTVIFVLIMGHSFGAFLVSLIAVGWVGPVYVARMFTIKVKDREFISASISLGASKNRVIFRHVLPNILGRLLVSFVHRVPSVIFAEATLVFLGIHLGGDGQNTLGNLLQQGRTLEALHSNPMFLISAASILLTFTLSLQIIANGLRDAFDPKVSG